MTMRKAEWLKGDRVWLVPTLPTAPTAAYKLPQVTIVTPPQPLAINRIEIELPDGARLWTNTANVRREPPIPSPTSAHRSKPKSALILADGQAQPTLW